MSTAKKIKTYHYHDEWEHDFFFSMINDKCSCLICNSVVAIPKKGNVERHFRTMHPNYENEYPKDTEIRRAKIIDLKSNLYSQQNMFVKILNKPVASTIASLRIAHILAKKKNPFINGELIKESFLAAAVTLFSDFKNKTDILNQISSLQLSRNTITRRIETLSADIFQQLKADIDKCVAFSLQIESNDVTDTAQLMIFIKMVFDDCTIKEELLKMIPMQGRTRGQDVFSAFNAFVKEEEFPLFKLVSITTDGAPSMTGRNNGFIALCQQDDDYPEFLTYHCIIHQQVLCSNRLNTHNVMKTVFKISNNIRSRPNALQRRLFRLDTNDDDELLLHTNVRWLSRSRFLLRFLELFEDVKSYIAERGDNCPQLTNKEWILDLAFLADFTGLLSKLNLELQGKNKYLINMISSIRAFEQLLKLLKTNLRNRDYKHFPSISKYLQTYPDMIGFNPEKMILEIDIVEKEFKKRFQDFEKIEHITLFCSNVFNNKFNLKEISLQMSKIFEISRPELELEIISIQNDLFLKTKDCIWKYTKEKYPILTNVAQKLMTCFSSTYLAESAFSDLNILKSKTRNCLTNVHLDQCLRLSLSSYNPNFESIAKSTQCQISH